MIPTLLKTLIKHVRKYTGKINKISLSNILFKNKTKNVQIITFYFENKSLPSKNTFK